MPRKRIQVVAAPPAAGLHAAAQDFLAAQRAQGNSPHTDNYYTSVLNRVFLPWCAEAGVTDFGQLDQRALDDFNGYLLNRPEKPLAKSSAASYLRAVRHFVRWSEEQEFTTGLKVRQVKVPKRVLDTLTRPEINQLEAAADTERDRLIIRVLADCGLRLGELLALKPEDILEQRPRWYLRVEGRSYGGGAKGDRGRLVPIRPELARRLRKYATQGRHGDDFSGRIFVTLRRRRSGQFEPLDARGAQVMLKAAADRAGITKRLHPHALRHAFVTNSLRAGVNPLLVAQMAGHRDLSMIQSTYSHLNAGDAFDAMMRAITTEDER
jgi:integrase/recombinase XerD